VSITGLAPSLLVTKTATPASVTEPSGTVTFTVQVQNTSGTADPFDLESLLDSVHGSLAGQGDCSVPQTIQPSQSYSCSFQAVVEGNAGDSETDTVTASGADDDGVPTTAVDSATVTIAGTDPILSVSKTVSPSSLPEPGGTVTFTVLVNNTSNAQDPVTISALTDDVYGDLTDISDEGGTVAPQLTAERMTTGRRLQRATRRR
jgi:hypothetical protein